MPFLLSGSIDGNCCFSSNQVWMIYLSLGEYTDLGAYQDLGALQIKVYIDI